MICENIEQVKERITEACDRMGRDSKEVTLIAVSKTKPIPDLKEAYGFGVRDFGENKVQELVEKAIQKAERRTLKSLFSNRYDKEGFLILKEQHFKD